jgi:hypothetical protein
MSNHSFTQSTKAIASPRFYRLGDRIPCQMWFYSNHKSHYTFLILELARSLDIKDMRLPNLSKWVEKFITMSLRIERSEMYSEAEKQATLLAFPKGSNRRGLEGLTFRYIVRVISANLLIRNDRFASHLPFLQCPMYNFSFAGTYIYCSAIKLLASYPRC